jgi:hypothetical protein
MSTNSWKKVVIGRQRMLGGSPRGLYGGTSTIGDLGPFSQAGCRRRRSVPNLVTPSLSWLTITYRKRWRRSSGISSIWPMSFTTATSSSSVSARPPRTTSCIQPLE